jgi:DNA polymerase-3 subunit alpha
VNAAYVAISEKTGIPVVAANDCHYINKGDDEVQDVLLMVQTKKTINDKDRFRFSTNGFWLKSQKEMIRSFKKYHKDLWSAKSGMILQAIKNTHKIADMCNVTIPLGVPMIPKFGVDDPDALLKSICKEGWKSKISIKLGKRDRDGYWADAKTYEKQITKEIKVITDMKLSDYFLIIADMVSWARKNDILVGNARGSVAGSLVAYCMGITDIDPIKFGLLFERFLTYDRKGVGNIPDIDLDFQHDRRNEVKEYLENKWGKDHVASIITFGTMGARGVLKDVCRAFAIPFEEVNFATKFITPKDTLETAYSNYPFIRKFASTHKKAFDISRKLEGQVRHYSTHAAGVLITDKPMTDICPIQIRGGKEKLVLSQWHMGDTTTRGLLKIDLLGLKTLTLIKQMLNIIEKRTGRRPDLKNISLVDKKVYKEFSAGNTIGIFQFENPDFQELLRRIQPNTVEDLAIANALGRPGAKLAKQDQIYLSNKRKGKDGIRYAHPLLKDILGRTYGALCFQEQVMEICSKIGNIPINETNDIREAIKKFKHDVMSSFKKKFIKGAIQNGLSENIAHELWESITVHSSYSFNRNHATSYSLLSYYMMYLKTYYPKEFMCIVMGMDSNDDYQIRKYIMELRRLNVPFWVPDYMHSRMNYSIAKKGGKEGILCGFISIKGIGLKTAIKIMELRKQHKEKYLDFLSIGVLKKLQSSELKLGNKY